MFLSGSPVILPWPDLGYDEDGRKMANGMGGLPVDRRKET